MSTIAGYRPGQILLDTGPSGPRSLHRLMVFLKCAKLYAFEYLSGGDAGRGGRPLPLPPSPPLVRGTLTHVGMAHIEARRWAYQNQKDPDMFVDPVIALDVATENHRHEWAELADTERDRVRPAIKSYLEMVEPRATHQVVGVEQTHRFQVVGPRTGRVWEYTQKVDLVTSEHGYIYLDDLKTTSASNKQEAMARYSTSLQFLGQRWWGPQFYGDKFGGCRIRQLVMRPPYFCTTAPVGAAPTLVRQFPQIVEDAELEIERLAAQGRHWEDYTALAAEDGCVGSYGACRAYEPCKHGSAAYEARMPPELIKLLRRNY
jgi:PD-(D/E)XK nuclease superfamily